MYPEYLQGMNDYKSGYDVSECPFSDFHKAELWKSGWSEAWRNDDSED